MIDEDQDKTTIAFNEDFSKIKIKGQKSLCKTTTVFIPKNFHKREKELEYD